MGRVSLPPPVRDTNLSHRLSFENNTTTNNNNNNLREASFSSYLNHAEKEFVRKLAESTREKAKTAAAAEDGDIEVFGAEKYFNGGIDDTPKQTILKKPNCSTRSGTPSVRSESSWNSQNAFLMQNTPSNSSKKKIINNKTSQFTKGFLSKSYCCCDKKSVSVEIKSHPKLGNNKSSSSSGGGLNFTFQSSMQKLQIQGRNSIEVFGKPPNLDMNHLEKRLSRMTWNHVVPRNSNSIMPNLIYNDDDGESDKSSDLFEIESLTGNPNSFLTRQGSDSLSPAATTCYAYAPSEASIDWSVVTASAADFSALSDYDERRLSTSSPVRNATTAGQDVKEIQRRRSSNLLMGCKKQKAVRVAGDVAEVHRRSESFGRLTRFEGETKIMGFGSNSNQRLAATTSLPQSYSNENEKEF